MPSMRPPTNNRTDFESHREAGLLWISNPGISCEDQNWVADHFHKLYDTAGPPITRLWLEGRIPDYIQHRLLMFLIQVQPPIEILIMQDSLAPFWLLPTILQLVKNVQTLELRDAIIDDSEDVPTWWSLVCRAIGQCQSLQCITLGWTHTYHEARGYEATVDPPKATPATDLWTKALMALPKLEVYVQEGWEPIDGDPWSRTNLLRLLNHPSLMAVRLAVPLVGVWPVGTPKVYPARKHSLDLILPYLPNDWQILVQHLPDDVSLLNIQPQSPQKVGTTVRPSTSPVDVLSIWQAGSNDSAGEEMATENDDSMGDETAPSQNRDVSDVE